MKMFIPILCIVSVVVAEPPVGDEYAAARSSHALTHQHGHQRSPSQEYGSPDSTFESARSAPSGYEYNSPNARASSSARGRSKFPPATVRISFNQRFSSAAARNLGTKSANSRLREHTNARGTSDGSPARSLSQEYGVPSVVSARTLSTEYGMPDARSAPSQEYGVPVIALSGVNKSSLSKEYGVPVVNARSNQKSKLPSNFRNAKLARSHDAIAPATRSQFSDSSSNGYSGSSARPSGVSKGYDSSMPVFGTRKAPAPTYGVPSSRSHSSNGFSSPRNSETQNLDSISQKYGAPNRNEISETYEVPNARSLSQEHHDHEDQNEQGVPAVVASLMTKAVASSFASVRSSPSSSYMLASRSAPPSEQYGTPEQNGAADQGYDYANRARALEEELQNQEPANYDFGYQIEDQESGSDFGHSETREADKARGSYFVVRPDGSKQTVEYEADERGFKPRISVEPADAAARSGGYDDNAQGLASQGPY